MNKMSDINLSISEGERGELGHWGKSPSSSLYVLIDPVNIILSHVIRGPRNLSKEMTLTWSHAVSLNYSNDSIKNFGKRDSQQQQKQWPWIFIISLGSSDSPEYFLTYFSRFGIILYRLNEGFRETSVSGYKQQGRDLVEEFAAMTRPIHPDQCPLLTVLLWSFSALLFWSMNACCLRQNSTERVQTTRSQNSFPLTLLQAHHVPKHH